MNHKYIIDLFSGVGGLSSGFIKNGFKVFLANEIDSQIAQSYEKNHKDTIMVNCLIEKLLEKIKENNIILPKIEGIIGWPPCQGFSSAGKRNRKNFINDLRNYLFREYFKIINLIKPNFFVIENVPGLLTMEKGLIFEEIKNIFNNINYQLSYHIVNAIDFGVPQQRKRLIIIGYHKDFQIFNLKEEIDFYKKENNIKETNIEDAISDLNYLEDGKGTEVSNYLINPKTKYQEERRNSSINLYNHKAFLHNEVVVNRMKKLKPGENYKQLDEKINSIHSGSYGRLSWDKPATTIKTRLDTPSSGRVIHPELNRTITPREAARIQSFDDNFIFYGNKSSICKQIGNAVPPLLSYGISKIITKNLYK